MIADLVPNLGELVIRCLAVAGGAFGGALMSGGAVKAGTRLTLRRQVPPTALNGIRLLGGVALGLAVYLIAFGPGGDGFGFGGSGWFGSGGKGSEGGPAAPTPHASTSATTPQTGEVLRIEILGGERYKGETRPHLDRDRDRFYLVEGNPEPQTWNDVRQLSERNERFKVVEIVILQKGSVAEGHEAVRALKQLAGDHNLTVRVLKPASEG
jgi:hypothetical protein